MEICCPDKEVYYEIIHCYLWCNRKCRKYLDLEKKHPVELHQQVLKFLERHSDKYELIYTIKKRKKERSRKMAKKFICQVNEETKVLQEEELLELCKTDFQNIRNIFEVGSEFEVIFKLVKKTEPKPEKAAEKKKG